MMEHPHDDIEAFVLGSLDEVSARRVLVHADECPTCAVLLAEAMNVVSTLETPGTRKLSTEISFADNPLYRDMVGRPATTRARWVGRLATIAAAVVVLIWSADLVRTSRTNSLTIPVASLVHSHFSHHALHGDSGSAKVIQALDGRWLYVLADGLRPKTGYRLFETVNGTQQEVGTFTTTSSGQATGYWEQAPTRIDALAVEPQNADSTSHQELRWP